MKKHGEISLTGVAYPNPSNQCWPEPVPYIFRDFGMQMLQQPHQITILYSQDHEVRRVRMNQPHPAQVTPSWYGDSVGRYEGDTLVIDTVGVKTDRPLAMVDVFGTPFSAALHVVERYRRVEHGTLQLDLTIDDPKAYTKSWGVSYVYKLKPWDIGEEICTLSSEKHFEQGIVKPASAPPSK